MLEVESHLPLDDRAVELIIAFMDADSGSAILGRWGAASSSKDGEHKFSCIGIVIDDELYPFTVEEARIVANFVESEYRPPDEDPILLNQLAFILREMCEKAERMFAEEQAAGHA